MTERDADSIKYFVCCPMCENKKCVRGSEQCEAEQWKESKRPFEEET